MPFDPHDYPPAVAELVDVDRRNALGPGEPRRDLQPRLEALTPESIAEGRPLADPQMAEACLSGLWLLHDFLDASHRISQSLESSTGSYWHAIMHRREPDYSNSKYWFRQVGSHPVYEPLQEQAVALSAEIDHDAEADLLAEQREWDPMAFVDLCQQAERGGPNADLCRAVQAAEWELLFEFCYRRATGT